MIIVFFLQGLAAFSIGIIALLISQYEASMSFQRHFKWLGLFGFISSVGLWGMMSQEVYADGTGYLLSSFLIGAGVIAAGFVLLRFGLGMMLEHVHVPGWWPNAMLLLSVLGAFVVAYILIVILEPETNIVSSIILWSHLVLFLPGVLLASFECVRAHQRQSLASDTHRHNLFLYMCIGLLLYGSATVSTHVPLFQDLLGMLGVQISRLVALLVLAACVASALRFLEMRRRKATQQLELERHQARQMAATIHTKTLQQAGVWLNNLIELSSHIANMDAVDDVLLDVVARARRMLDASFAGLALVEQDGKLGAKVQVDGNGSQMLQSELDNPVLSHVVQYGKPIRMPEDTAPLGLCWRSLQQDKPERVAAVVPLKLDSRAIGVLWVAREISSFSCTDLIGLGHLSDQAVIALEHASMASRLQSLAVVEERSRIAREMHDSLAQILAYLGVELQTLQGLAQQGNTDAMKEQLKVARGSVKSAQADVRESILCLRTTLSGETDLVNALGEYLDEFTVQTGIRTEFHNLCKGMLRLSPLADTQLVRIVQEALTNVRKHACADYVTVHMQVKNNALHVEIVDNGIGFDQQSVGEKHFGLETMRERAESVYGSLVVNSNPGAGTQVRLVLPLM